ncbi:MAG: tetratricopeptide (TPR) repeat protein [Myxococcota bacterium]|jgi:tetratricopeptide (TPR) repeat protein
MLLLFARLASATSPSPEVTLPELEDSAEQAALFDVEMVLNQARLFALSDPNGKSIPLFRSAAEQYLQLCVQHPESRHSFDFLYSAGVLFERIGDSAQAHAVFSDYVTRYPSDKRAYPLMFRLAGEHQQALELDKAIRYYDKVAQIRSYPDAASAAYNAAFLRAAKGDHRGTAEGLERCAEAHPELPDARALLALAGLHWGMVGDAEAEAFYQRFVPVLHRLALLTIAAQQAPNNPGIAADLALATRSRGSR